MILVDNKIVGENSFPDGTFALRIGVDKEIDNIDIEWYYASDSEMVTLYYITKHLKNAGFKVSLYMPYIPNARMDRVKNNDEVFTLKYFAEFINSLGFETVFVRDPHSNVSCALIDNLKVDNGFKYIMSALGKINDKDIVLYYPDEGAMKRYSEMIVDRPYAFGIKCRDWRTGNILGISLINGEVVKGKNVLIVDDICSKGGTFYYSAKALKDAGANDIYLYVTHCENTIYRGKLIDSDLIKHIYTTKSIFSLNLDDLDEKITVLK